MAKGVHTLQIAYIACLFTVLMQHASLKSLNYMRYLMPICRINSQICVFIENLIKKKHKCNQSVNRSDVEFSV